jgi:hypothetical protein
MSLFFMVVAISLWLDQLCNGNIGRLDSTPEYKPFLIVTLIVSEKIMCRQKHSLITSLSSSCFHG